MGAGCGSLFRYLLSEDARYLIGQEHMATFVEVDEEAKFVPLVTCPVHVRRREIEVKRRRRTVVLRRSSSDDLHVVPQFLTICSPPMVRSTPPASPSRPEKFSVLSSGPAPGIEEDYHRTELILSGFFDASLPGTASLWATTKAVRGRTVLRKRELVLADRSEEQHHAADTAGGDGSSSRGHREANNPDVPARQGKESCPPGSWALPCEELGKGTRSLTCDLKHGGFQGRNWSDFIA